MATRYLCNDPSHRRGDEQHPVDVTSQVRLERAMVPNVPAILAYTERVIDVVEALDPGWSVDRRAGEIQRAIAGETRLTDAPVILVSEHSVTRPPGLYEMDELRLAEPVVDALSRIALEGVEDVVLLDDHDDPLAGGGARREAGFGAESQRTERRTRVVPQGIYPQVELSLRLANAAGGSADVVTAIRETPPIAATHTHGQRVEPWRVVITCPEPEGSPPVSHRTVFTGSGGIEPAVMVGTPANGWDVALETSAEVDLEPSSAVATLDRRLRVLLFLEIVVATTALVLAWVAGSLGLAAREAPGWLGLAVVLGLGAMILAAVPLFAGNRTHGNADDTFELRRYYGSRLELLSLAPAISAGVFALAMLSGWLAPALAADDPLPPVSVSFEEMGEQVNARILVAGRDLATDETLHVEMREFAFGDETGSVAGHVTTTGDASGAVPLAETIGLRSDARYLSVQVWVDEVDDEAPPAPPVCTPSVSGVVGCTVVAVPSAAEG